VFIALHDPTFQQTVRLGGATQPLAYDLSAPLGHYPRASAPILAVRGLLRADKVTQRTGLYIVEPYDPSRIPVVLVHGLLSTPHMWLNIMNAVRADPQLRTRYQFWVFYYPTANPGALSSWALRNDLAAAERIYHPRHGIVLVGHSMGEIISRMQAVDTGDSANGSDGVVPYRSAHLDSARSEKIIPYGHSGYQSPESIAELLRILRLQVGLTRKRGETHKLNSMA
jgi:pimeloyl-ACP methyl ester carboxylesterase